MIQYLGPSGAFFACFLSIIAPDEGHANKLDLEGLFPFRATDVSLNRALSEFTRFTGVPVKIYQVSQENVTLDITDGAVQDFLNELALQARVSWWYDGQTLHFEDNARVDTKAIATKRWHAEYLIQNINDFGVNLSQYPITFDDIGNMLYINGPENYVRAVSGMIDALMESYYARKQARRDKIFHPLVFSAKP